MRCHAGEMLRERKFAENSHAGGCPFYVLTEPRLIKRNNFQVWRVPPLLPYNLAPGTRLLIS